MMNDDDDFRTICKDTILYFYVCRYQGKWVQSKEAYRNATLVIKTSAMEVSVQKQHTTFIYLREASNAINKT